MVEKSGRVEVGGKCRCSRRSHKMPGTHKMPTLPPSLVGFHGGDGMGWGFGIWWGFDKQRQLKKRRMCGPKASARRRTRSWPSENGKGN